jgi:hypothetical protein
VFLASAANGVPLAPTQFLKPRQFVPLSDAPTFWLTPETSSRDLDKM